MINEIDLIEKERNILGSIEFIEKEKNQSLDNYLRVLFLILDFLVDDQYSQEEHNFVSNKFKNIFEEAKMKYSNYNDFLFYIGMMIFIAEWYFGFPNTDNAFYMLKEAHKSNPENKLYNWGLYCITDQRPEVNTQKKQEVTNELLNDELILEIIKNKGLLGKYTLGIINCTLENTKANKSL